MPFDGNLCKSDLLDDVLGFNAESTGALESLEERQIGVGGATTVGEKGQASPDSANIDPGTKAQELFKKGYSLIRLGMVDDGVVLLKQANVLDPDLFDNRFILAQLLSQNPPESEEVNEALGLFKHLLEMSDNITYGIVVTKYSELLLEYGDVDQAIELCLEALKRSSLCAYDLYTTLGKGFYELGDFENARKYLEQALYLEEDSPTGRVISLYTRRVDLLEYLAKVYYRMAEGHYPAIGHVDIEWIKGYFDNIQERPQIGKQLVEQRRFLLLLLHGFMTPRNYSPDTLLEISLIYAILAEIRKVAQTKGTPQWDEIERPSQQNELELLWEYLLRYPFQPLNLSDFLNPNSSF